MVDLPTGTVTMLFSDIEGSTALLTRLGPAYADALSAQRRLLRRVWAEHGGTEMGTEGDSFFVVFPTAPAAVLAASQAQRDLAALSWPKGEQVRVRMGIHTGSPDVHDGGYVGIDVHRAARIAATAHGGQVVLSDATARLVSWTDGQPGVRLRDLGRHQLKDIPAPEHLFQLDIDGLRTDFPALKTLGAASSLPEPATSLVGRDGELAELTAVLGSRDTRLLTLTGPGGSGKTRLALDVARRLALEFSDGVYFVPLATVTTTEVMWTTIAEAFDVPAEGRIPPGLFTHLAHRSALVVLDNLEQIARADTVVSDLLREAPQVVVLATSRGPLHLAPEYEHPVPPLELPRDGSVGTAEKSGAVQLFVQQAKRVRPGFSLTAQNAGDVTAVCRRLDGLPLAIELAAVRSKLLSPRALLARLDSALDLEDKGVDRPDRQRTLRRTIAWSYDLLTPELQRVLRLLGVFAGGAEIDALLSVSADDAVTEAVEALEALAALLDASLVVVTESLEGEPRASLLDTVRSFARDKLVECDELADARERHAHHFAQVAQKLRPLLNGPRYLEARMRFEIENDNFREALSWSLQPSEPAVEGDDPILTGLRLCIAMGGFWVAGGYFSEARGWLDRIVERAGGNDSPELAGCIYALADLVRIAGDLDTARHHAAESVAMCRRVRDTARLGTALGILAGIQIEGGDALAARASFEEAVAVARTTGDRLRLLVVTAEYATLENAEQHHQRALELHQEALDIAQELEAPMYVSMIQHDIACTMREMGRVAEAELQLRELIPDSLQRAEPGVLLALADDYAAVLSDLGDHGSAIRLFAAADAMYERLGASRPQLQQAETAGPRARAQAALSAQELDEAHRAGRGTAVEDALAEVCASGQESTLEPRRQSAADTPAELGRR